MPRKKSPLTAYASLTWEDLENWADRRVVERGRRYQQQGRVSELTATAGGALIARVAGSRPYLTRVAWKGRRLQAACTCPYAVDCKHGVAAVLECLEYLKDGRTVPTADEDVDPLASDRKWAEGPSGVGGSTAAKAMREVEEYLRKRTKVQLVDLCLELVGQHAEIAREVLDRAQLVSGNAAALISRLGREIADLGEVEAGWSDWQEDASAPDYDGILRRLQALLAAGRADDVLRLGGELLRAGNRRAEWDSDADEFPEFTRCVPALMQALEHSSLDVWDRLAWAVGELVEDEYGFCDELAEYLHQRHSAKAWDRLADLLLAQLVHMGKPTPGGPGRDYKRDRITNWILHALDRAGRTDDALSLCEAEATATGSYVRLVERLLAAGRYADAERWIRDGIGATESKWPGIASQLRAMRRKILTRRKDWPQVTAGLAGEFVRRPSPQAYAECRGAANRIKSWPVIRLCLLEYLEKGTLPWKQKAWPPAVGPDDAPEPLRRADFPLIDELVEIALYEKEPAQVLWWYDKRPRDRYGWLSVDEDVIAGAVAKHAPERAIGIWKNLAEREISRVSPNAYLEAARYLRKAAKVAGKGERRAAWDRYLADLKETHRRKRRLLEILARLDGQPAARAVAARSPSICRSKA